MSCPRLRLFWLVPVEVVSLGYSYTPCVGILIVINIGVVCTILGSRSVRKLFPFLSGVARPQDFFFFISVSGQTVAFARVFAVAVMPCHTFSATRDPGSAPSLGALPLGHSPARPCPWPLALAHAQDRKPPTHMHTKNAVHLAWPSCTLAHAPLSMGHGRPWPLGSSLMSHPPLCALVLSALRRVGRRANVTDRPFAAAPCPRSPVPRRPSRAASPPPPSRRPPTPPPEWPG